MNSHNRCRITANQHNAQTDSAQPVIYQIRFEGHLRKQWTDWFDGPFILLAENGDTLLTGLVINAIVATCGITQYVR